MYVVLAGSIFECDRVLGLLRSRHSIHESIYWYLSLFVCVYVCPSPSIVQVVRLRDGKAVDAACRDRTASWVRASAEADPTVQLCEYFEVHFIFLIFFVVPCSFSVPNWYGFFAHRLSWLTTQYLPSISFVRSLNALVKKTLIPSFLTAYIHWTNYDNLVPVVVIARTS